VFFLADFSRSAAGASARSGALPLPQASTVRGLDYFLDSRALRLPIHSLIFFHRASFLSCCAVLFLLHYTFIPTYTCFFSFDPLVHSVILYSCISFPFVSTCTDSPPFIKRDCLSTRALAYFRTCFTSPPSCLFHVSRFSPIV
jgi:hypothetical protein